MNFGQLLVIEVISTMSVEIATFMVSGNTQNLASAFVRFMDD